MKANANKLTQVLDIAMEQRALLARGDLEAVQALQVTRQQLLEGIQSLDVEDQEQKAIVEEILKLDKTIHLLLSSEVIDIHRKMLKIKSIKKLFHTRRPTRRGTPRYISRRI